MSFTQQDRRRGVYSRLNEALDSDVAELPTGGSTAATIASDDQINAYLDSARALLTRTVYPVLHTFSATVAIGTRVTALHALTPTTSGYVLWRPLPRGVSHNGVALAFAAPGVIQVYYPDYHTAASGTPLYWSDLGAQTIALYPRPSAAQTLSVEGLAEPPSLSTLTSWIADEDSMVLEIGAAALVCAKNLEDASLAARLPVLAGDWLAYCHRLWERVDPTLRLLLPGPQPIVAAAATSGG